MPEEVQSATAVAEAPPAQDHDSGSSFEEGQSTGDSYRDSGEEDADNQALGQIFDKHKATERDPDTGKFRSPAMARSARNLKDFTDPGTAAAAVTPVDAGTTPAPAVAQPASTLSPEDRELYQRFGVEESDVSANPVVRARLANNLRQRHNAQSELWRANQALQQRLAQLQQGPPPQQPQPQQPAPVQQVAAGMAELRAKLDGLYGTGFTENLQPFIDQIIPGAVTPLQQQLLALTGQSNEYRQAAEAREQQYQAALASQTAMIEAGHIEQGMDKVSASLPDVDFSEDTDKGKANRAKLFADAHVLLQANYDPANPNKFNARHALIQASSHTFQNEKTLAERAKLAKAQVKAIRGSPDRGGRPGTSRPAPTEDDIDDSLLDAQAGGADLAELQRIARVGRR